MNKLSSLSDSKQLYTYMHSGDTKDSGFGALTEALMPAPSSSNDQNTDSNSVSKENLTLPLR